tara:strand:+ start:88 stop:558 length:471 start_codon:yes stop_codon:yes gene_type:complete
MENKIYFAMFKTNYRLARYFKCICFLILLCSAKFSFAEVIQIEITDDEAFSIEVARINVGDTINWLPNNEGHNVAFFAGPDMTSLPESSEMDANYSVMFDRSGMYLYGCTPHANNGMIGLIVVGNDFHNLNVIKQVHLSSVAKSVLDRLLKSALAQ